MSRVMLALGSFIVGACCASIISFGIQTSTWAQVFEGGSMAGGTSGIVRPDAEPVVPPLPMIILHGTKLSAGVSQQLDGLDCEECILTSPTLTYAGGLFRLNGKTTALRLTFKGPAANTVALLNQLGAFRKPESHIAPPPAFSPPKFLETKADTLTLHIEPKVSPSAITLTSLPK